MHLDTAGRASVRTLASLRPLPVPPIATIASASSALQRVVEAAALAQQPRRRRSTARAESCAAAAISGVVAHRHRRAHAARAPAPDSPGAGERGNVDSAQALAGTPHRLAGVAVAAGRQHALAVADRGHRLGAVAGDLTPHRAATTRRSSAGNGWPTSMRAGARPSDAGE